MLYEFQHYNIENQQSVLYWSISGWPYENIR